MLCDHLGILPVGFLFRLRDFAQPVWVHHLHCHVVCGEAIVWLRILGRTKREKKLARFLKSFLSNWQDYFTYLEFPGCPKTSNAVEQFNRRFEKKRQTMHVFRKERTARSFTSLFALHSMFRRFEARKNKGKSPLEIANVTLAAKSVFDLLPH